MAAIAKVLLQAFSEDKMRSLYVSPEGEIAIGDPGGWDLIKAFFNEGQYAAHNVVEFLELHKHELIEEAKQILISEQTLTDLNGAVKYVYHLAGMERQTPDIAAGALSDWMGLLPAEMKKQNLFHIVLPGTHDSAAYKMDWSRPILQHDSSWLEWASKGLAAISGLSIVEKWTITQHDSITQQLEHGVRLFDLRLTYNEDDHKFYFTHTFTVGGIEEMLQEFHDFMESHPTEVIQLHITPDWEYRGITRQHFSEAKTLIESKLGSMLSHSAMDFYKPLEQLVLDNTRILLSTDQYINAFSHTQWVERYAWLDTQGVQETLNAVYPVIKDSANTTEHYAITLTVTPEIETVLLNASLESVSKKMNSHLQEVIELYEDSPHTTHLSSIALDYATPSEVELIVKMNFDHSGANSP